MPAIIFLFVLFLFFGGQVQPHANAGGHEPWTLTVTGINCTTAVSAPIDCGDVLAMNKVVTYTITNLKGFSLSSAQTFPATLPNEALHNSLAHELHRQKYVPKAKSPVAPGLTITK